MYMYYMVYAMCKFQIVLIENGTESRRQTFEVDGLKVRRFREILENDLSELRRVELCPIPEATEYEEENDWPMTEAV